MTRERIEDFREIVLPFLRNILFKTNYENLGKSDAEEFARDFNEILDLAIKALEQEPTTKNDLGVDCISRQAVLEQAYAYGNGLEPDGYCVNVEDIQALPSVTPQPCEDAVSRDAVLDLVADYDLSMGQVVRGIHALPLVTSQEPRKGHWISTETKGVRYAFWCRYKCSLCGGLSDCTNFCPNCGARMVEPQESEGKE